MQSSNVRSVTLFPKRVKTKNVSVPLLVLTVRFRSIEQLAAAAPNVRSTAAGSRLFVGRILLAVVPVQSILVLL
jgi:hypothetical protein